MAYVITDACVKDFICVEQCATLAIAPMQGDPAAGTVAQVFINPDECIDCGACEPACPVSAIFEESAVPAQWREYIQINADYFKK